MAWYRQYRPQRVQDLHIVPVREQLQKILDDGQYAHAYIFAGPKGTGKTSSARILARVLNEPKNQKSIESGKGSFSEPVSDDPVLQKIAEGRSQVVIEQDAASHRGIDDIRQLHEHISVVPTEGFVRVVILDEVHMLTNEAFNALLKMLEEPPKHVVFVLATTELHKVPATVQSRCQLIRFRQATSEEIQSVIRLIAAEEKIAIDDDVVVRIAKSAQGSFRDAVKYFEQIVADGVVNMSVAESVLGNDDQVTELLRALAKKEVAQVDTFFAQARENGVSFRSLEQSLLAALQERLSRAIQRQEAKSTLLNIVDLLEHFSDRLGAPEPIEGIRLEVACLRWCVGAADESSASAPSAPAAAPSQRPKSKSQTIACAKEDISRERVIHSSDLAQDPGESVEATGELTTSETTAKSERVQGKKSNAIITDQELRQKWPSILLAIREHSSALESLLRNARPDTVEGTTIHIALDLSFHKERLESTKYAHIVQEVLEHRLGVERLQIAYDLAAPVPDENAPSQSTKDDLLLAAVEEALLSAEA